MLTRLLPLLIMLIAVKHLRAETIEPMRLTDEMKCLKEDNVFSCVFIANRSFSLEKHYTALAFLNKACELGDGESCWQLVNSSLHLFNKETDEIFKPEIMQLILMEHDSIFPKIMASCKQRIMNSCEVKIQYLEFLANKNLQIKEV